MSVACSDVNVKNAGCLVLLKANVEVGKRGKSENLNCKFKKDKFSNKDFLFESILSSCASSSVYVTLYSANYMVIEMHFFFINGRQNKGFCDHFT